MQENDDQKVQSVAEIPTSKHWADLVLRNDKSIIIALVLTMLGIGVFWYSFNNIQSLSQPPRTYNASLDVITEGCGPLETEVTGWGETDQLRLRLPFYAYRSDSSPSPLPLEDCWIRKVAIRTNWLPEEVEHEYPDGERITSSVVETAGRPADQFELLGRSMAEQMPELDRLGVRIVNGKAGIQGDNDVSAPGVRVEYSTEEAPQWRGREQVYRTTLEFSREWQPASIHLNSLIDSTPKTNFRFNALQFNNPEEVDNHFSTDEVYDFKLSLYAWGEEVMMKVGELTQEGQIEGQGYVNFAVDSGTIENRREAGLIQYSTMLGIGVALLTEAFVIFLALTVLEIGRRTWRKKK